MRAVNFAIATVVVAVALTITVTVPAAASGAATTTNKLYICADGCMQNCLAPTVFDNDTCFDIYDGTSMKIACEAANAPVTQCLEGFYYAGSTTCSPSSPSTIKNFSSVCGSSSSTCTSLPSANNDNTFFSCDDAAGIKIKMALTCGTACSGCSFMTPAVALGGCIENAYGGSIRFTKKIACGGGSTTSNKNGVMYSYSDMCTDVVPNVRVPAASGACIQNSAISGVNKFYTFYCGITTTDPTTLAPLPTSTTTSTTTTGTTTTKAATSSPATSSSSSPSSSGSTTTTQQQQTTTSTTAIVTGGTTTTTTTTTASPSSSTSTTKSGGGSTSTTTASPSSTAPATTATTTPAPTRANNSGSIGVACIYSGSIHGLETSNKTTFINAVYASLGISAGDRGMTVSVTVVIVDVKHRKITIDILTTADAPRNATAYGTTFSSFSAGQLGSLQISAPRLVPYTDSGAGKSGEGKKPPVGLIVGVLVACFAAIVVMVLYYKKQQESGGSGASQHQNFDQAGQAGELQSVYQSSSSV